MSDRENTQIRSSSGAHATAAEAFVDRTVSRFESQIVELYVFGSTVRGESNGLASDVDVLVVLADVSSQSETSSILHDIAYDIMLEYGPVVELHILSESEFDQALHRGNPFIRRVVSEGRSYV